MLQPVAKDERAVSSCQELALQGLCSFTTSSWLIYSCLTLQVSRYGQSSLIIKLQGLDPINSTAVKILGRTGIVFLYFFRLPLYLPWSRHFEKCRLDSTILNSSEKIETFKSDFTVVCLFNAAKLIFLCPCSTPRAQFGFKINKSHCLPQTCKHMLNS